MNWLWWRLLKEWKHNAKAFACLFISWKLNCNCCSSLHSYKNWWHYGSLMLAWVNWKYWLYFKREVLREIEEVFCSMSLWKLIKALLSICFEGEGELSWFFMLQHSKKCLKFFSFSVFTSKKHDNSIFDERIKKRKLREINFHSEKKFFEREIRKRKINNHA